MLQLRAQNGICGHEDTQKNLVDPTQHAQTGILEAHAHISSGCRGYGFGLSVYPQPEIPNPSNPRP